MKSPNDDVSADDPRPTVTTRDVVPSDETVIDGHIKRADFILITHTHPDHTLDLPYIACKTGATVVGTESTAKLARVSGVPERQLKPAKGGENLKFDGCSVRVMRSVHGIFRKPNPGEPPANVAPPLFRADAKPPFSLGQNMEAARSPICCASAAIRSSRSVP